MKKILVTGATGYVGGRLIPYLLDLGYSVRAMGRSQVKLKTRPWATHRHAELVTADIHDLEGVKSALQGCDAAYYLIHSMLPGETNFAAADRGAAQTFVTAVDETKSLKQIIYLGGLGDDSPELSKHLKSRLEVAEILKSSACPVTILRAAMIIGTGSASFEILRYLVERLPIMITPKWLTTPNQPIAIRNVVEYLAGVLFHSKTINETFDIGGTDIPTYHDLMKIYAEEAGLPQRLVIRVPVLTPRLSSYWIHLVTPVPASIARPLAEGLKNPVVCNDTRIREIVKVEVLDTREAIRRALSRIAEGNVVSHWTDAGKMPPPEVLYIGDPNWAGGTVFRDERTKTLEPGEKDKVWDKIVQIGGQQGWYHGNRLWVLRGFVDKMIGGVGLRRGRRDPKNIQIGDALDFWRVLDFKEGERLLLAAEMKLPGKATLEFKIDSPSSGPSTLYQTAKFVPRGLFGIVYWYCILPLHEYIFGGMIKKIASVKK